MKILLFAPNYLPATRYGGPVRSSHGLAKGLVGLGHEVDVLTTNMDGPDLVDAPVGTVVDIDGVQVRYFDVQMPRRIYYAPMMGRVLDAEAGMFDIVHTNGMFLWPGPKAARAAARHKTPVVVSPRGMLVPELIAGKSAFVKKAWINAFERRHLAAAAAIHVTSEEEAKGLRQLGLDLSPLVVIGNGVDVPNKAPDPAEISRVWGDVPPGRRVAFLGRLDRTKGIDLAIDAVAVIPGARLRIAGHDQIGLRATLESRITSEHGEPRACFIGPIDDAQKWAFIAGADVLLAPSVKESFGMAVAEALAIGTPVICSKGVGASTIVARIDRDCVVPRTSDNFASALEMLLADDSRRDAYGRRAKKIVDTEYSWQSIAGQMLDVYARAELYRRSGTVAA